MANGLNPPGIETLSVSRKGPGMAELHGRLLSLGGATPLEVSAEYRDVTGLDVNERSENWVDSPAIPRALSGSLVFQFQVFS